MFVSMIIPVCNQGNEARETVKSAQAAMGGLNYEIIVVDDQSIDGSCHDMPKDVLVLRTDKRLGVSGARRYGFFHSEGDILLWSDPHCRYPEGAFEVLVGRAADEEAIIEPRVCTGPGGRQNRYGGRLAIGDRAINCRRQYNKPAKFPSLDGTIYAMKRSIYEKLGGWPLLPGCWGYSEQAMTIMAYYLDVPIRVEESILCVHKEHGRGIAKNFPFKVRTADPAQNGYYIFKAFFPLTYEKLWGPKLRAKWGFKEEWLKPTKSADFERLTQHLAKHRVREERDFLLDVLGMSDDEVDNLIPKKPKTTRVDFIPVKSERPTQEEYQKSQASRSKPKETLAARPRIDNFLDWIDEQIGGIRGQSFLDVGARDGYLSQALLDRGATVVTGIEYIKETADYAASQGRPIIHGDAHNINCESNAWDNVIASHVLEHCYDPDKALAEMYRVLRIGGHLLIAVPKEDKPKKEHAHYCAFPDAQTLRGFVTKSHYCNTRKPIAIDIAKMPDSRGGRRDEIRIAVQKRGFEERIPEMREDEDAIPYSITDEPEPKAFTERWEWLEQNNIKIMQARKEAVEVFNEIMKFGKAKFVEIGGGYGGSWYLYAGAIPQGSQAYCIDDGELGRDARNSLRKIRAKLQSEGYDARWIRADAANAVEETGGAIDVLHIDGPTKEDAISRILEVYRDKLSKRAMIILHDVLYKGHDEESHEIWSKIAVERHEEPKLPTMPDGDLFVVSDKPVVIGNSSSSESPWYLKTSFIRRLVGDKRRGSIIGTGMLWFPTFSDAMIEKFDKRWDTAIESGAVIDQNKDELRFAAKQISEVKGPRKLMVEIGSYQGGSLYVLAGFMEPPHCKLIIVDNGECGKDTRAQLQNTIDMLRGEEYDVEWVQLRSQDPEAVKQTRRLIGGQAVDVLHIDGDHRKGRTKADYLNYGGLVRKNGLILFHDACADPVRRSIRVIDAWKYIRPTGRYYEFRKDAYDVNKGTIKRRGYGVLWV